MADSSIDSVSSRHDNPNTDVERSIWRKLFKDVDEPMCARSMTKMGGPRRIIPYASSVLPSRQGDRSDRRKPSDAKSSAGSCVPIIAIPYNSEKEPMCKKLRSDNKLPGRTWSNTSDVKSSHDMPDANVGDSNQL